MSHTNQTQYYELPQYVGTDIINPLVDTNGAYQKIDTALHNIAEVAGQSTTDIADLQTKVGNGVFATTAQDATGAVNELYGELNDAGTGVKDRIVGVENDVDTLQTQMQTANTAISSLQVEVSGKADESDVTTLDNKVTSLETAVGDANSGLIKDVADVKTDVTSLETTVGDANSGLVKDVADVKSVTDSLAGKYAITTHHAQVSVANDGVKTFGDQMNELAGAIKAIAQALPDGAFLRVTGGFIFTPFNYPMYAEDYTNASNNINIQLTVLNVNTVPNSCDFFTAYVTASTSKMFSGTFGGSQSDTWANETAVIATNTARLYYDIYEAI